MYSLRRLLSPFRRRARLRRGWLRVVLLACAALAVDLFLILIHDPPSTRVSTDGAEALKESIFIASMHWNNEAILRSHWNAAMLNLVEHFGHHNVYVSIVESGSWDDTKGALRELDAELDKLGVERSIELLDTTHEDEITRTPDPDEEGWILTSRGKKELRRISYLSGIRNRVMEKLNQIAERTDGAERRTFDKVLWLNDVIFTIEDVTSLLATREGDYAAVCSLDFSKPPIYYDTFALRDISGEKAVTQTWPYFLASESRRALMSNSPVPVKSCWNGIIVFQADPFYEVPPLQFRGVPDSLALKHLEGSECCLIHADNELTAKKGVWLNPNVRVSYNPEAYAVVNPASGAWLSKTDKYFGIWGNRWARWMGFPLRFLERDALHKTLRLWQSEGKQSGEDRPASGSHCMINEMQVLVHNGWKHL